MIVSPARGGSVAGDDVRWPTELAEPSSFRPKAAGLPSHWDVGVPGGRYGERPTGFLASVIFVVVQERRRPPEGRPVSVSPLLLVVASAIVGWVVLAVVL